MSQNIDRLFFLHFNKTAGTSLYRFLESLYPTSDYIPDSEVPAYQRAKFNRSEFIKKLSEFRLITKLHLHSGYLQQLRDLDPSFKAITVFRQPIERIYSQIEAWRRVPPEVLERVEPIRHAMLMDAREMSASNFIDKHWDKLSNRQAKMTAGLEQTETDMSDTALLERAETMLEKIDYVGLTSGLSDLASALTWSLGVFNCFNPQKLNAARSEHKLSTAERSSITKQVIELNTVDLPLFAAAERRAFNLKSDTHISQFLTNKRDITFTGISLLRCATQSMEQPLWGEGWHEREAGLNSCARWCGPQRFSSVYLPVQPDAPFFLRLSITSILHSRSLETLRIWINDCLAPHQVLTVNGALVVESAVCNSDAGRSLIKIVLESESVDTTHNLYSIPDYRLKTIAIERIEALIASEAKSEH